MQTFSTTSRLGAPFFICPELPKHGAHKKYDVLKPYFAEMREHGAGNWMRNWPTYLDTIMNRRLQPEPLDKRRTFQYVTEEGEVYEDELDEKARRGLDIAKQPSHSMRPRLVFNQPITNLYKQSVDTLLHHAQLQHPVFHHDMYTPGMTRVPEGYVVALDIKQFDRATAEFCFQRALKIGGDYAEIAHATREGAFLVFADDMSAVLRLWPDYEHGYAVQYASGDSAVAPAQKDLFAALSSQFCVERYGLSPDDALEWYLRAGDERLGFLNYGDDNVVFGDQKEVEAYISYIGALLTVERESPTKFLGFLLTDRGWRLGVESYLLKTYLNERNAVDKKTQQLGTAFRKYPSFGWVEKRKGYSRFGVPELQTHVFTLEDELLRKIGYPWGKVLEQAVLDANKLGIKASPFSSLPWLLNKDYLLTPEEKVEMGLASAIPREEVALDMAKLLDPKWFELIPK